MTVTVDAYMKVSTKTSTMLAFILLALAAGKAFAQGSVIGGGDDDREHEHIAWFVDASREIRFCIARADTFPIAESDIAERIAKTFKKWETYASAKAWRSEIGAATQDRIATKTTFIGPCTDLSQADVRFYFGVEDQAVNAKMEYFHNPSAFAVRTDYDVDSHWGRGFVWFRESTPYTGDAPTPMGLRLDWTKATLFDSLLLHEVGHILGIGHIPETIMRSDIVDLLYAYASVSDAYNPFGIGWTSERIDQDHELIVASTSFVGAVTSVQTREMVKILTGAYPEGIPTMSVKIGADQTVTLTFHVANQDDIKVLLKRYEAYYEPGFTWISQGTVFKKLLGTAAAPVIKFDDHSVMVILYRADLPDGGKVMVEFQHNTQANFAGSIALIHEGEFFKQLLRVDAP